MNKFNSIFGQILQIFPRSEFYNAVIETGAESRAKGLSSWQQFVAMLFCQIGQAHSLMEICGGLASCVGKLRHLGVGSALKGSTLSYANEHRPWQLNEMTYHYLGVLSYFQRARRSFGLRTSYLVWMQQ